MVTADSYYPTGTVSIDSETIETIIGVSTRFKGSVQTGKVIRIDGVFDGTIESDSLVIISETGLFTGTLSCRELRLDGCAEGTVSCSELIRIADIGRFSGDLTAKNIIMTEGSLLDGTVVMKTLR